MPVTKPTSSLLTVHTLPGFPIIQAGDNVGKLICEASKENQFPLEDGDILVVAQTIISRAEGRIVKLSTIEPSDAAKDLAQILEKRAELVEVILQASKRVVRAEQGHLIVETPHGFVCANAGVDSSNVPDPDSVTLLPEDPDHSASQLRKTVQELCGVEVGVIISDTQGRPFREGAINVAIGTAGLIPLKNYIGLTDLFGYKLQTTKVAVGDELASAAELLMGEADEGNAVVVIRGYSYERGKGTAQMLVRDAERDIFRR